MNLPNKLTLIRLICVPIFVALYLIPYEALGIHIPVYHILNTSLSLMISFNGPVCLVWYF